MPPAGFSLQACLALGLHSVSELATREPEPVLPSAMVALSAYVSVVSRAFAQWPVQGGIPRGREVSLAAEPKGKEPIGAFQMLLPHGDECDVRSASVPLSERALPKSRDRVWGIGLVSVDGRSGGEGATHIACHGGHITTKVVGRGVHVHWRGEVRRCVCAGSGQRAAGGGVY